MIRRQKSRIVDTNLDTGRAIVEVVFESDITGSVTLSALSSTLSAWRTKTISFLEGKGTSILFEVDTRKEELLHVLDVSGEAVSHVLRLDFAEMHPELKGRKKKTVEKVKEVLKPKVDHRFRVIDFNQETGRAIVELALKCDQEGRLEIETFESTIPSDLGKKRVQMLKRGQAFTFLIEVDSRAVNLKHVFKLKFLDADFSDEVILERDFEALRDKVESKAEQRAEKSTIKDAEVEEKLIGNLVVSSKRIISIDTFAKIALVEFDLISNIDDVVELSFKGNSIKRHCGILDELPLFKSGEVKTIRVELDLTASLKHVLCVDFYSKKECDEQELMVDFSALFVDESDNNSNGVVSDLPKEEKLKVQTYLNLVASKAVDVKKDGVRADVEFIVGVVAAGRIKVEVFSHLAAERASVKYKPFDLSVGGQFRFVFPVRYVDFRSGKMPLAKIFDLNGRLLQTLSLNVDNLPNIDLSVEGKIASSAPKTWSRPPRKKKSRGFVAPKVRRVNSFTPPQPRLSRRVRGRGANKDEFDELHGRLLQTLSLYVNSFSPPQRGANKDEFDELFGFPESKPRKSNTTLVSEDPSDAAADARFKSNNEAAVKELIELAARLKEQERLGRIRTSQLEAEAVLKQKQFFNGAVSIGAFFIHPLLGLTVTAGILFAAAIDDRKKK